ncbi:hypothetical protein E2C01_038837 [Portunus trituberculatus]|uniref:Uncharacterized protein n=1 Tax=Portunus trituberculatus TaxID=210409 RepID=A0A5B7FD75_PORTR|nr:hypothetical protein [Portunus trituberculatus]
MADVVVVVVDMLPSFTHPVCPSACDASDTHACTHFLAKHPCPAAPRLGPLRPICVRHHELVTLSGVVAESL